MVLNNQPQGGLAMRARSDVPGRFTVSARAARRNVRNDDSFGSNQWRERDSQYGYARQSGGEYYFQQR